MEQVIHQLIEDFRQREIARKEKRKYEGVDLEDQKAHLSQAMRSEDRLFMGPYSCGHRSVYILNENKQKKQDPRDPEFLTYFIKCWAQNYNCDLPDIVINEFPSFFHQHLDAITQRRYEQKFVVRCTYKKPILPIT